MWFGLYDCDNKLDIDIKWECYRKVFWTIGYIGNNYRYVAYNALLRKNRK